MSIEQEGGRHIKQTPTIHILVHGFPLCNFSSCTPNNWPDKGKWVGRDDKKNATCVGCINTERAIVNETHPELRKGEVWLQNLSQTSHTFFTPRDSRNGGIQMIAIPASSETPSKNIVLRGFEEISWKTKRLGKTGYNYLGEPDGTVPVFVKKEEVEKKPKKT